MEIDKLASPIMLEKEAIIFTHYFTGSTPEKHLIERYISACQQLKISENADDKILRFMIQNPHWLPFLDAALALNQKNNILRIKLLVMLSILETTPEFYHQFSSSDQQLMGWFRIFFRVILAVIKCCIGKCVLFFI